MLLYLVQSGGISLDQLVDTFYCHLVKSGDHYDHIFLLFGESDHHVYNYVIDADSSFVHLRVHMVHSITFPVLFKMSFAFDQVM